jgi:hypothetical protein
MTTPADVRTDEEAFAACLAGRAVPAGAQGLAAFTDAVRASATEPGRPNAALTELLATGLLVPTQEPSPGTAGRAARTSRKRPHVLISTLVAKFAAAGAVAKAATATGVVAVALTAGGVTIDALSTPDDTGSVLESGDGTVVDPTDSTDPSGGSGAVDDGGAVEEPTEEPGEKPAEEPTDEPVEAPTEEPAVEEPVATELTEDEWAAGPVAGQSHGDWVSAGARNGWVTGERVSDAAHQRNADRKATRAGADAPVAQPEPVESAEPVDVTPAPAAAPTATDTGGRGHDHGNGNGNGNGKNGK